MSYFYWMNTCWTNVAHSWTGLTRSSSSVRPWGHLGSPLLSLGICWWVSGVLYLPVFFILHVLNMLLSFNISGMVPATRCRVATCRMFIVRLISCYICWTCNCWTHVTEMLWKWCWSDVEILSKWFWNYVEILSKWCWNTIEIMLKCNSNNINFFLKPTKSAEI
jgi:hypothetical protein